MNLSWDTVVCRCPDLKVLSLPLDMKFYKSYMIPKLIGKWKHLESLSFRCCYGMEKILREISFHCKKFCALQLIDAYICKEKAIAITLLPKIKQLILREAIIDRDNLIMILRGCKELVLLDVRDCTGFDPCDDEILKLASHISKFSCEGSKPRFSFVPLPLPSCTF